MILFQLDKQPLNSDFQTDWIPMEQTILGKTEFVAASAQISWENVTGTLNGNLQVQVSNDGVTPSFISNISVNCAMNKDNAEILSVESVFRYIRFSFSKNGIASGTMDIIMNYIKKV